MVDLFAAVRKLLRFLFARAAGRLRRVLSELGLPVAVDPALEEWAEHVFGEFKQAPLVQPSRDLVQAVRQRIEQLGTDERSDAAEHEPHPHQ
jgi:hypothetical protein